MNPHETVLIVDDVPENIDVLSCMLRDDYKIKAAINGDVALKICAGDKPPDIVLLDVMMPGMDGFQVCEALKSDINTKDIPVIFVTAKSERDEECKGLLLGAADYISKPISPELAKARVRSQLNLRRQSRHLQAQVRERTAELAQSSRDMIWCLARAAGYKESKNGAPLKRMGHYSHLLARSAGLEQGYADLLMQVAPLHNIGTVGIPDAILFSAGRLDEHQRQIMQTHPQIAAELLGSDTTPLLKLAREVVLSHHEKWDGTGYPVGLKGEAIPMSARIVAVADVFDALTSHRAHRPAWEVERAITYIEAEAGRHFDPFWVSVFFTKYRSNH